MARTRSNGQPLSVEGFQSDLFEVAGHSPEVWELFRDFQALLGEQRAASFDAGMQLGAKVEHRVAVEAIQQAALTVLGKDRGDGAIQLGALGSDVYKEV
jgi:hypothetical protein